MPTPRATRLPPERAAELASAMPKVLLHEHLDGGLRVGTLLELLRAQGLAAPADDAAVLAAWFDRHAHAGSLPQFLAGFVLTIAAMSSAAALERVAFEAAEDALADGVVLAEFRAAPTLFGARAAGPPGLPAEAAVEAMLAGLARSALPAGLILCAMRERAPAEAEQVARLAARYLGHGVVGFDLAGPEHGYPPALHARAFAIAREAGVPITCHAGEADAAERVLEAIALGARRIGHGVRLVDWLDRPDGAALIEQVRAAGVHLEVCPTSNVLTGAVPALAQHPIARLWHAGLSLSFHTDSRLISCTSASAEAAALLLHVGLEPHELMAMTQEAAAHSFLPPAVRAAAQARISHAAGGPVPD